MKRLMGYTLTVLTFLQYAALPALALDAAVQAKIDAKKAVIASWGKDPVLVAEVKAQNASPSETVKSMTQAQWDGLTILDPKVRAFQSGKAGEFLKSKKEPWVAEAFVSAADGAKVGFLGKTTSWTHKGKPKHDRPIAGETWQGELETDKSSGKEEIQVAVPVLDGTTAIGSLVVGIEVGKL